MSSRRSILEKFQEIEAERGSANSSAEIMLSAMTVRREILEANTTAIEADRLVRW